jgi:hypothetical protein
MRFSDAVGLASAGMAGVQIHRSYRVALAAIRSFIARLSGAELPSGLAAGIADLLRATQHIEEVATLAAQMRPARLSLALDGEAKALLAAAEQSLSPLWQTRPDAPMDVVAGQMLATEQAYQAAKSRLLKACVAGHISPSDMDSALEQAQLVRRAAEAALKAKRRFLPWAAQAAGEDSGTSPSSLGPDAEGAAAPQPPVWL